MSSEKKFSLEGSYKFILKRPSTEELFEVNTLDETSCGYGRDGNKLHDLPENSQTYT